jgi:hypothetical protein
VRLSGPGFLLGVPVLGGLFTLVTAVILARVGGRLLGIGLSWRRAILTGFPGLVLGWIAAWSINGQRYGPQVLSWLTVLFGALIATMLIAALLDLLARPGRFADLEGRLQADVIAELSRLQDHVAAADPAGIEALLTAELGAPSHRVFAWFEAAPLAAASIGQAHRARLATGFPCC